MEEVLSGIVLGGVNFSENDKILSVLTLEQGVVSAKIKGVKKAGAKLKFASEPFCFAQFVFAKTGKNRTVTGASLIDSFYPIRQDVYKYFAGGAVLEYTRKFLKEGIVSTEFFHQVSEALKLMAYSDQCPESVLIDFLINALSLSGYALNLEGCFTCGEGIKGRVFFDYLYGGFFCEQCITENCREISYQTMQALQQVKNGQTLSRENCLRPLRLLDFYLDHKAEVSVKSLKELIRMCGEE